MRDAIHIGREGFGNDRYSHAHNVNHQMSQQDMRQLCVEELWATFCRHPLGPTYHADSLDRASTRAKLRMVSLASVNGPSVTVILPPEEVTRVPTRIEPAGREQHALAGHLLDQPVHLRHQLVVRRVSLGRRHQEPHRRLLDIAGPATLARPPLMLRTGAAGIDILRRDFPPTGDAPDVETGPAAPSCW
jgi:hypothetical protein